MAVKYKHFYNLMVEKNQDLFDDFKEIHDAFANDETNDKIAEEFHSVGREVKDKMHDWERRLCSGMGRGQYAHYTTQLSEKFWDHIRKTYPLIDKVGLKVVKK